MMFSPIARQKIAFLFLSVIVAIATVIAYYFFNPGWVTYRQAEQHLQKKEWTTAAILYEEALNKGLNHPMAMVKLARAASEMKNYKLAIFWYEKYVNLFPKVIWARKAFAETLVADGQFDRAAKEYERILELENNKGNGKN